MLWAMGIATNSLKNNRLVAAVGLPELPTIPGWRGHRRKPQRICTRRAIKRAGIREKVSGSRGPGHHGLGSPIGLARASGGPPRPEER